MCASFSPLLKFLNLKENLMKWFLFVEKAAVDITVCKLEELWFPFGVA